MSSDLDDQWLYGGNPGKLCILKFTSPANSGWYFATEDVQSPVKVKTEPVIKENGNGTVTAAGRLVFLMFNKDKKQHCF